MGGSQGQAGIEPGPVETVLVGKKEQYVRPPFTRCILRSVRAFCKEERCAADPHVFQGVTSRYIGSFHCMSIHRTFYPYLLVNGGE